MFCLRANSFQRKRSRREEVAWSQISKSANDVQEEIVKFNDKMIFDGIFAFIIKPWFTWVFWTCRGLWYNLISYSYYCFIKLQNGIGSISDHFR